MHTTKLELALFLLAGSVVECAWANVGESTKEHTGARLSHCESCSGLWLGLKSQEVSPH